MMRRAAATAAECVYAAATHVYTHTCMEKHNGITQGVASSILFNLFQANMECAVAAGARVSLQFLLYITQKRQKEQQQ